jgi:hypothetical protein
VLPLSKAERFGVNLVAAGLEAGAGASAGAEGDHIPACEGAGDGRGAATTAATGMEAPGLDFSPL